MRPLLIFVIAACLPCIARSAFAEEEAPAPASPALYSQVILNGQPLMPVTLGGRQYLPAETVKRFWGPLDFASGQIVHAEGGDLVPLAVFDAVAKTRDTADGAHIILPTITIEASAPEARCKVHSSALLNSSRVWVREDTGPRRLIIELFGALNDPVSNLITGHSLFPHAGIQQNDLFPDKLIITVDLHGLANYDISFLGNTLQFTFFVYADLTVTHPHGATIVSIPITPEVKPFVFTLSDPYRIVVDLPGFVNRQKIPLTPNTPGIRRILCGYLEDLPMNSARCVLELTRSLEHEPVVLPDAFVLTVEDSTLYQKTVVIDPGHGGKDPGTSVAGLAPEKSIVLGIALYLKTELEHRGAAVVLTRGKDEAIPNHARIAIANSRPGADAFLTLHLGESKGAGAATAQGVALNIANDRSRPLADALRQSMIDLLKMNDRGVKKTPSLWFRAVRAPAVLLASGYLTHPDEAPQIADQSRWQDIAMAIADGLESYFAGLQAPARQSSTE